MDVRLVPLCVSFLAILLVLTPPASANHWDDERPSTLFGATPGDARILGDSEDCREEAAVVTGATCIVLYAHVLDLLNTIPLTVQRPADCRPDIAQGFTSTPGIEPFWDFTRMQMGTTVEPIRYIEADCEERPRGGWARGITRDAHLHRGVPIFGYWTLSADTLEMSALGIGTGPDDPLPDAGAMPCITVRMQLLDTPYDNPRVLAEGQTTKTVLTTPVGAPSDLPDPCPDSEGTVEAGKATEFRIDLGRAMSGLNDHKRPTLLVQWYQWDGGDPDAEDNIVQREWNLHAGAEHVPRLVLPLLDPFHLKEVRVRLHETAPRVAGASASPDTVFLSATVSSPWSRHDVDLANSRLALFDEEGQEVPLRHLAGPRSYDYPDRDGAHYPTRLDFTWRPLSEELPHGTYTLAFKTTNWQHSADVHWNATLESSPRGLALVTPDGTTIHLGEHSLREETPHLTVPLLLLAVAAATRAVAANGRRQGGDRRRAPHLDAWPPT